MSEKSDNAQRSGVSPWWQTRMRVTMFLADAAQVVAGKLYILGGGWSIMGPHPTRMVVAMKIEIPWDHADQRHDWELSLLDSDGRPVACAEPGDHPVRHHGHFHANKPAGAEPGVPVDFALVVDAGTLTLPPGGRYVWRLMMNGASDETWQLGFTTRPARS